ALDPAAGACGRRRHGRAGRRAGGAQGGGDAAGRAGAFGRVAVLSEGGLRAALSRSEALQPVRHRAPRGGARVVVVEVARALDDDELGLVAGGSGALDEAAAVLDGDLLVGVAVD